MSKAPFAKECLQVFKQIEKQRVEIFSLFDGLKDEQLHFNSGPEKWNLLEVAHHLMTSEKLSVIYIKRKTGSGQAILSSGILSKIRLLMLRIGLNLPVKFKAPNKTDATGKNPDYESLKSDWQKVRIKLKSLIEDLDETTLKSEIFKHPRVGMMNMKQALKFLRSHIAHHQKQIERIMNHQNFPTGE